MALWMIVALGFLAVGARCQSLEQTPLNEDVFEVQFQDVIDVQYQDVIEVQQTPVNEDVIEVQLGPGSITGERKDAGNGRYYYAFKNIPYAQPPIGGLRFRDPVPSGQWMEHRNGSLSAPKCPQVNLAALSQGKFEIVGQEDCLYLNVYTPKPFQSDLPVMVYIHGGAFLFGDVNNMSPLPLLTEDVVLVTFHYRLGTLGFLSTEDSVMPGNLGLKDQTLALKWVHDNIRELGGDPQKVTIFGVSTGAVSVHFQVLTPYASGLFNQAILHSGTALCSWSTYKNHSQVAAKTGQIFNCSNPLDSAALLQCLQTVPVQKLVTLPRAFVVWSNEPLVMIPRVDGDYIPADPAVLLKEERYNKVNLITGITAQDGAVTTKPLYSKKDLSNSLVQNFSEVGPVVLNFRDGDENPEYLARRVFYHYLGDIEITDENADAVTQLFTDRLFSTCNDHTAQLHARDVYWGRSVYMYELHHRGQYAYFPDSNPNVTSDWVGHGDDEQYLFDSVNGRNQLERPGDLMVRHIMVKLWTNFVTTGNPTPNQSLGFRWQPVTRSHCLRHLRLKPDAEMHRDERSQTRAFWENLPTRQNKILFPELFGYYYAGFSPVNSYCP